MSTPCPYCLHGRPAPVCVRKVIMANALPLLSRREEVRNRIRLDQDPIALLTACQARFGDVYRLTNDTVVMLHPDDAQEVLSRTGREFDMSTATADIGHPTGTGGDDRGRSARPAAVKGFRGTAVGWHAPGIAAAFRRGYTALAGVDVELLPGLLRICG